MSLQYTLPMDGIQSLYAIGGALCLFSSGIVSATARRDGQPLSYFIWYLGLEALCFALELLVAHPATPLKALWLSLLMSTSLLIAPCLWLAIKECVERARPSLSSIGSKQRAAIVAGAVLTLPLLETAHFGTGFSDPNRLQPTRLEPIIHPTMVLCLAIFAVQVPFYLWRCRRLLADQAQTWLQLPLVIVGTTWLLGIARTIDGVLSHWSPELRAMVALVDVGVTVAAVYLIVRKVAGERPAEAAAAETKYARSPLDASVRTRIARKLEAAFGADELYRDATLSLGSLSRRLNESEHYVSQTLNQELGTTFYELVSSKRIELAKRLLVAEPDRNVLEIALAVGFNAKSTFNQAFRRCTGMTPREFRTHANGPIAQ